MQKRFKVKKHYDDIFEDPEFMEYLEKELDEAEEEIKNGDVFRAEDVLEELRQQYLSDLSNNIFK